jgi:FMN phosphatase YigB (HAD superfamily)
MGIINLVCWDVYGTLVETRNDETSDVDESQLSKPRAGALEIISEIDSRGINQMTISDRNMAELTRTLKEAKINPRFFGEFYEMIPHQQKDMSYVIQRYGLKPQNLLVIGDNYDIDIALAKEQGCQTLWTPENKLRTQPLPIEEIKRLIAA